MRLLLFKDNTVDVDLAGICDGINSLGISVSCEKGKAKFAVPTQKIAYPATYRLLSKALHDEAETADLAICCTAVPYDNNFFYEFEDGRGILSFFVWDLLTTLSPDNGLVYFIAAFISDRLPLKVHKGTTACISDFLANKADVDLGMRFAFLCPECIGEFEDASPSDHDRLLLAGLQRILEDLQKASRANLNVVDFWKQSQREKTFDVFLCHNSNDRNEVLTIARLLRKSGLRPWLDQEQLRPGLPWQDALEEQIAAIGAAAVLVGKSNLGPWQSREIKVFLNEFVRRRCPVIPVLLESVSSPPDLPLFLQQMQFIDFRKDSDLAMKLLIWGITGVKPRGLDDA